MNDKPARRTAPPINLDYMKANFWSKVEVGGPDDCWLWRQSSGSHGYGQTWDGNTVHLAHRVAWELTYGSITDRLTVDHICRVRRCCNPAHLRLLPNVENATDNGHGRKTHCPSGHPYSGANLYIQPSNGSRRCRACAANRRR